MPAALRPAVHFVVDTAMAACDVGPPQGPTERADGVQAACVLAGIEQELLTYHEFDAGQRRAHGQGAFARIAATAMAGAMTVAPIEWEDEAADGLGTLEHVLEDVLAWSRECGAHTPEEATVSEWQLLVGWLAGCCGDRAADVARTVEPDGGAGPNEVYRRFIYCAGMALAACIDCNPHVFSPPDDDTSAGLWYAREMLDLTLSPERP